MHSMTFYVHAQMMMFSEHARHVLLFYAHAYWGWGLSMATDGCSVCMAIIIVNSKLRGAKQDSVPYMVKIILTHILSECGVVDPYVDRFLNGSG